MWSQREAHIRALLVQWTFALFIGAPSRRCWCSGKIIPRLNGDDNILVLAGMLPSESSNHRGFDNTTSVPCEWLCIDPQRWNHTSGHEAVNRVYRSPSRLTGPQSPPCRAHESRLLWIRNANKSSL